MARWQNWLPRCGAFARSTGLPCRRKPVLTPDGRIRNGRCVNHGGTSSGPKTKAGHDRCTAGRIAYYEARRAAGLSPLPRKAKAAPTGIYERPGLPPETPEAKRERILQDLRRRFPERGF